MVNLSSVLIGVIGVLALAYMILKFILKSNKWADIVSWIQVGACVLYLVLFPGSDMEWLLVAVVVLAVVLAILSVITAIVRKQTHKA